MTVTQRDKYVVDRDIASIQNGITTLSNWSTWSGNITSSNTLDVGGLSWKGFLEKHFNKTLKENPMDKATLDIVGGLIQKKLSEILDGDIEEFISKLIIEKTIQESETIVELQKEIATLRQEIRMLKLSIVSPLLPSPPSNIPPSNISFTSYPSSSPTVTTTDTGGYKTPDENTPKTL